LHHPNLPILPRTEPCRILGLLGIGRIRRGKERADIPEAFPVLQIIGGNNHELFSALIPKEETKKWKVCGCG
jgi:hypothetical protein